MATKKLSKKRAEPHDNRIPLAFEEAVEGLLNTKPKKNPPKKNKKQSKK